mmetsp:Transcript_35879/g.77589  ORF Transcript_35879/g.77589 Transcript_35879/m.77589 type:complete len:297 (+) Transcript_35879:35-925(+)
MLRQCRYSGLLEIVHIRQHGFPHRLPFAAFLGRYAPAIFPNRMLSAKARAINFDNLDLSKQRDLVLDLIARFDELPIPNKDPCEELFVGNSKVYYRSTTSHRLEHHRQQAVRAAATIQALFKTKLTRQWYIRCKAATIIIQRCVRKHLTKKVIRCIKSIIRVQAIIRGIQTRQHWGEVLQEHKDARAQAALVVQHYYRQYLSATRKQQQVKQVPAAQQQQQQQQCRPEHRGHPHSPEATRRRLRQQGKHHYQRGQEHRNQQQQRRQHQQDSSEQHRQHQEQQHQHHPSPPTPKGQK